MQSDDFSEIEIVDLPEDVEEAGNKVKFVDLPLKEAKRQPERQNLFKGYSHSIQQSVRSIDTLWRKQRRKINVILMVSTILLALFLLNSAGGSFLFRNFSNTTTSQGKTTESQGELFSVQSNNNDLMASLFRATPPGPAPNNCPASLAINSKQSSLNEPPLEIFGFHGPQAHVSLHVLKTFKSTRGNLSIWGTQLIVQMDVPNPPTVWLHLTSLNSHNDPIFGHEPGTEQESPISAANGHDADNVTPSPSTIFLNPNNPEQNNGEARALGNNTCITSIDINAAGCYTLTACWPN